MIGVEVPESDTRDRLPTARGLGVQPEQERVEDSVIVADLGCGIELLKFRCSERARSARESSWFGDAVCGAGFHIDDAVGAAAAAAVQV